VGGILPQKLLMRGAKKEMPARQIMQAEAPGRLQLPATISLANTTKTI
jgi:hypothetical protein